MHAFSIWGAVQVDLDYYFALNPIAQVEGIDLAWDMLAGLKENFSWKAITITQGSYFNVTFEKDSFDAVVSVVSCIT